MIGSRIVLIPVLAAVGYEVLKWGAKHRGNPIVRTIMWPGILVQMITTKQPTPDMIEVAIVSMEEALTADAEAVPAGSARIPRGPLELPGKSAPAADAAATPGHGAHGAHGTGGAASASGAPVTIDPPLPGA
mgnify:CR=1 FL=1